MATERHPMTQEGYNRLKEELDRLKQKERPQIVKAIAEARAHGDLAENAEYHAARERQSFIEGRIAELEVKISRAEVITPPKDGERITFGSTLLLKDESGKEIRYRIVGSDEAEPAKGKISVLAPLARSLIGKEAGEAVIAQTPGGKKRYEILEVNFPWED